MISTYFKWMLNALVLLHGGTFLCKIKASFWLAFLVSPVGVFIHDLHKWRLDNSDYIFVVLGAIIIDHALGTIKHAFYDRDFELKKNIVGLLTKVSLVLIGGFLFEGMNTIVTKDSMIKDYLEIVTRLMVFIYPAGSAFTNMSVISKGKFPPASWLLKLNQFNKNLDPSEFGKKDPETPNNHVL